MSVQVSSVLATARTLLNDDNATTFTDATLIPKLQEAHRELQTDLWLAGSPIVRGRTAVLTVAIGAVDLGANQPADLLAPTNLMEASHGGTDWVPMTEYIYIPLGIVAGPKLIYWAWRAEKIEFLGATADRDVVVFYRKQITIPVLNTDPIGIAFGELYLAARTAAMTAGSVGNAEVYAAMTAIAKDNFSKVISANRGQQKPINKP